MSIVIFGFQVDKAKKFEINIELIFNVFSYMTKWVNTEIRYLKNNKIIERKMKSIFIIFKGFSVAKSYFRPGSGPLKECSAQYSVLI